MRHLLKDVLL